MRLLSIILLPAVLTACSAKFDAMEYSRLVDMRHTAYPSVCVSTETAKDAAARLRDDVRWLAIYSRYLPNNEHTVEMVSALNNSINGFSNQYATGSPSEVFCRLQIDIIANQLNTVLESTARRLK